MSFNIISNSCFDIILQLQMKSDKNIPQFRTTIVFKTLLQVSYISCCLKNKKP
nr:MAG TPA: hypothetical protein [Caudoviricetes sp.]